MKVKSLAFIIIMAALMISCQKDQMTEQEPDYILNQDIFLPNARGDSAFLADPHVIKVDDTWYLYATGFSGSGLGAWSSKDLINWKLEGLVWRTVPGAWNSANPWAPEVVQGDDGFYMYYTANQRIGVAYSTSPTGPFEEIYDHPFIGGGYGGVGDGVTLGTGDVDDPVSNILDFDEYAIDASILKASDGSLWIYFSIQTPASAIAVLPMKDYRTLASNKPVMVLAPDIFSWEGFVREGAFLLEKDGVFHLMYSGSFWNTNDYAVGVATGPTPLGPFTRRADNPILRKSAQFNLAGPGHHCVVEGKYNDMLIFYHTRRWGEQPTARRRIRYMQMYFDRNGQIQIRKVPPK